MKIGGTVTVTDNSADAIAAIEAAAETALDAAGSQAATLAKMELQKYPERIDTGLLRNSITWALGGGSAAVSSYSADRASKYTGKVPEPGHYTGVAPKDTPQTISVYIGTNVEYAYYVHDGTDRMAPNRFLKNAISKNRAELSDIIKKNLQNG